MILDQENPVEVVDLTGHRNPKYKKERQKYLNFN